MMIIESTRGGITENRQTAVWVMSDLVGTLLHCTPGAADFATFFRSSAKPFQLFPLVRAGYDALLTEDELAVACASHTASAIHLALVRSILVKSGQPDSMLGCGPHAPLDSAMQKSLLCSDTAPERIHNNCSGKHAAMLLYCKQAGLPTENYLDLVHPLQQEILAVLRQWGGVAEIPTAVDGCGAPVFYLPLVAMARLYAQLGTAPEFARIAGVMARYPDLVGGPGRVDSELMAVTHGRLLAKVGADGLICVSQALEGCGLALKMLDGDNDTRNAVIGPLLKRLGWLSEAEYQAWVQATGCGLQRFNTQGRVVGECRILWDEAAMVGQGQP